MNTLTTRDRALQDMDVRSSVPKVAILTTKPASILSRMVTWYKSAVMEPETEQERAEWQQGSF